jgi:hypothetical protein
MLLKLSLNLTLRVPQLTYGARERGRYAGGPAVNPGASWPAAGSGEAGPEGLAASRSVRARTWWRSAATSPVRAWSAVSPGAGPALTSPHPVNEPVKHSAFAVPVRQPCRAAAWTRPGVSAHTASQPDTTNAARQRTPRENWCSPG